MPRPGPNVTSDADTQPGSDSLFPTGFSGGGALVRSGSVGTGEIADGSVASADLNLASVATALAARGEFTSTYAKLRAAYGRVRFTPDVALGSPATMASAPTITAEQSAAQIASSVQHQANSGDMLVLGPTLVNNGSTYFRPALISGATLGGSYRPWVLAFDLYGSKFEIRYSVKGAAAEFRVKVDGQYANPTGTALVSVNDTADRYALVDFGSNGSRRIELEMPGAMCIRWIATDVTSAVTPAFQNGPTALVIGDSYAAGFGVIGNGPPSVRGYAHRLRDLLGWGRIIVDAAPGTGYVTTANGMQNYAGRLPDIAANISSAPDVVVVQGSINDNGNGATLQAAATSCLQAAIAQWPNAVVLATGIPMTVSSGSYGNRFTNNTLLSAAAAAVGVPFVDLANPTVITGTGTTSAPGGVGNTDIFVSGDGVHPSPQGHEYMARRIASRLMALASSYQL